MSKYTPLADFLQSQSDDVVEMSFEQIDLLVGGLPRSAREYDAWWANSRSNDTHTWAHLWIEAGWECSVTRAQAIAVFRRINNQVVGRLSSKDLRRVTSEYIWEAVQALLSGQIAEGYGPSTDYDLIADGEVRLAPKQVFGLAATSALGFLVTPAHFTAGKGTVCFELLKDAGYRIIAKHEDFSDVQIPSETDEKKWFEGSPRFVTHLRRERALGLSKAKKAAFIRQHGRLFCEKCFLDPVEMYGDIGSACIEVHHHSTQLADMEEGHATTLWHLQCLCANCHRIEHGRLTRVVKA
jgi:hypothetical protein